MTAMSEREGMTVERNQEREEGPDCGKKEVRNRKKSLTAGRKKSETERKV